LEIHLKGALVAVVFWPEVITLASPRPASIMISVVMKGCSPTTDTKNALTTPSSRLSPSARPSAVSTAPADPGSAAEARYSMETAPATHITAPTDRSMPPVAITSVMPAASMSTGALPRRMSISDPYRLPLLIVTWTKLGSLATFTPIRASRATTPQKY
jgi:hypothetical protein